MYQRPIGTRHLSGHFAYTDNCNDSCNDDNVIRSLT